MSGKGILACNESTADTGRMSEMDYVEITHDNRQDYRDLLFTTPSLSDFINGVIMLDETIKNRTNGAHVFYGK